MSLTVELLRLIGSPFAFATRKPLDTERALEAYQHADRNKVLLLFLESITNTKKDVSFDLEYQKEVRKYLQMLKLISKISSLLDNANVDYAIIKTIRPYKSATVDVDILIFDDKGNYVKSISTMQKAGYKLLVRGPRSTTFWDQESNIGIDLYEQVAVSFMTYLDKEKIINYVTLTRLPNGNYVKTLKPEADLATIIAHSLIKEQMYTLSEYYTFIYYLDQMDIDSFIQIVKQTNIKHTARTHSAITALLHKTAHKTVPDRLQRILNRLGEETFETSSLIQNVFKTPHKYHLLTITRSFMEIAKGTKCRNSIATQFLHMLNPNFTKKILKETIKHVTRETY